MCLAQKFPWEERSGIPAGSPCCHAPRSLRVVWAPQSPEIAPPPQPLSPLPTILLWSFMRPPYSSELWAQIFTIVSLAAGASLESPRLLLPSMPVHSPPPGGFALLPFLYWHMPCSISRTLSPASRFVRWELVLCPSLLLRTLPT